MLQFEYHPPFNISLTGLPLNASQSLWGKLEMKQFTPLSNISWTNLVFVTGVSQNHLEESFDSIASIQKWFPQTKIVFYDLELGGLNPLKIEQVSDIR